MVWLLNVVYVLTVASLSHGYGGQGRLKLQPDIFVY